MRFSFYYLVFVTLAASFLLTVIFTGTVILAERMLEQFQLQYSINAILIAVSTSAGFVIGFLIRSLDEWDDLTKHWPNNRK